MRLLKILPCVRLTLALAVALGWSLLPSNAFAVRFWKNSAGNGNWSTGNNWSATGPSGADFAGVPGLNEPVRIYNTNGAAHTVTLDTNPPTLGLLVIDLPAAGALTNTLSLTTNNNLTAAGIFVGGHNGSDVTGGNGVLTQSAGTVTTSAGSDLYLASGAGSTGVYNLSGGALNANLSTVVGSLGTGTVNHSGGVHTLFAEAIGGNLLVGYLAGSNGTYNLSGTGQLISNKHEIIGVDGVGQFVQTGGTNTITGAYNLVLGLNTGSHGIYSITGGTITVGNNVQVGNLGAGDLNISGTGTVSIGNELAISNAGNVNLTGGTLRFNTVTGINRLNWQSGTLQLAGDRNLNSDPTLGYFFGPSPTIFGGKKVVIEGASNVSSDSTFTVNGGGFTSLGMFRVGTQFSGQSTLNILNGATVVTPYTRLADGFGSLSPDHRAIANVSGAGTTWNTGSLEIGRGGVATLNVTGGGSVASSDIVIGFSSPGNEPSTAVVSGPGSSLTSNALLYVGYGGNGTLTIDNGGQVYVGTELHVDARSAVNLNGGTIRFDTFTRYDFDPASRGQFNYAAGTVQLAGARTIGGDAMIQELYGTLPVIPTGKGLTVEGAATLTKPLTIAGGAFKTNGLTIGSGGLLDFDRGVLELTGGTITGLAQLNIPTNGEFRVSGTQSLRIVGAAGSTITATGNLFIGNNTVVNGFATQGTLNVGANLVSLFDANDAVLDSTSFTTLGAGGNPGILDSFNGITLNFGGNITGYGTISTLGDITTPLINNGHIIGNSAAQRITLPGYVKGVGTFDNVIFTGTFAPGLSPTSLVAGSVALSNTSTLLMELGGTSPGSGYDQILSSGTLALDGVLQLALINGFTPAAGQSFNLFDWSSASGTFDALNLPPLTGGLSWNMSQLYTTGVLSVTTSTPQLPGDIDLDGDVDRTDAALFSRHFGKSSSSVWTTGDFNGDAVTTLADLAALQANLGQSVPRPAPAAVPEPSTMLLVFSAFGSLVAVRRRKGHSGLT